MCACFFFFFIFCDFRFYTSNKQNAISKKFKKSDSTQNWNAFWKIIVQDKCQVSKNFKQSFLRYIEKTTGGVRNFAKYILVGCLLFETD